MFAPAKKRKLFVTSSLIKRIVIRFKKKLIIFSKSIVINKKGFIFAAA
jgi:hypothetical protein